jgi:hypothetical protein
LIRAYRKLRDKARPISDSSNEHYRFKHLEEGLGDRIAARLAPEDVVGYCTMRRDQGAGPYTCNMDVSKLSTALRYSAMTLKVQLPDAGRGATAPQAPSRSTNSSAESIHTRPASCGDSRNPVVRSLGRMGTPQRRWRAARSPITRRRARPCGVGSTCRSCHCCRSNGCSDGACTSTRSRRAVKRAASLPRR